MNNTLENKLRFKENSGRGIWKSAKKALVYGATFASLAVPLAGCGGGGSSSGGPGNSNPLKNTAPVCTLSVSPISGLTANINAECTDAEGNINSYEIYVDGQKATNENPAHNYPFTFDNAGTHTIKVSAKDSGNLSDEKTQSIDIPDSTPQNNPPVITSNPVTNVVEGQDYNYQIVATDADSDTLTYSLKTGPDWINVSSTGLVYSLNPSTGYTTAPTVTQNIHNSVVIEVSDGKDITTQSFTLTDRNLADITGQVFSGGTQKIEAIVRAYNTDSSGHQTILEEFKTNPDGTFSYHANQPLSNLRIEAKGVDASDNPITYVRKDVQSLGLDGEVKDNSNLEMKLVPYPVGLKNQNGTDTTPQEFHDFVCYSDVAGSCDGILGNIGINTVKWDPSLQNNISVKLIQTNPDTGDSFSPTQISQIQSDLATSGIENLIGYVPNVNIVNNSYQYQDGDIIIEPESNLFDGCPQALTSYSPHVSTGGYIKSAVVGINPTSIFNCSPNGDLIGSQLRSTILHELLRAAVGTHGTPQNLNPKTIMYNPIQYTEYQPADIEYGKDVSEVFKGNEVFDYEMSMDFTPTP